MARIAKPFNLNEPFLSVSTLITMKEMIEKNVTD